jgi:hypothetical protein
MAKAGHTASFSGLRRRLRELPRTVASAVATRAAPALTGLAQAAYDSPADVYGEPRPKSEVNGQPLTLYRTGETEASLRFASEGTILRAVLARPYIKYLIGKYRILPNGPMPGKWRATLDGLVQTAKAPP